MAVSYGIYNIGRGLRSFPDLTVHLTTRADDNHATPVTRLPKAPPDLSGVPRMSSPGEVPRYCRIKPHAPPLVRVPVNSFEF